MRFAATLSSGLLLCCAIPSASPAPSPDEDVSLTLDASILGTSWGERIDPDRDCKFRPAKDRLVIEVPGKYHDLWPKDKRMNAPRLLAEARGDFDAQVRVCVEARVSEKSTAPQRAACVAAGFLLVANQKSIFRAECGQSREWGGCQVYAGTRHLPTNGTGGGITNWNEKWSGWPLPKGLKTVWLRLERRGDLFRFLVSADGRAWKHLTSHGAGRIERLKIGLFAASTSTEPFAPCFNEWKLTPVTARQKKRD
jgi:hypothetical protein